MNAATLARFQRNLEPEPNTGCYLWGAGLFAHGYARLKVSGKTRYAHRLAYEHFVGPIPVDCELDHLCRVRSCVNPAHLEPVSHRENVLRSPIARASVNAKKERCWRGHELAGARIQRGASGPQRHCRECATIRMREFRARRAAA